MTRRRILGAVVAVGIFLPVAALRAAPADDAVALAAQAESLEAQGAHNDALIDLTRAIEMHALPAAEQARLLFNRGVILDAAGRMDDAAGDYSAAILLSSQFTSALNNRANVYRRQGRFDAAKRDYRASLAAHNPRPAYSWYGLGQVAEAEGNSAAARDAYARAVAADPDFDLAVDRLKVMDDQPAEIASDVIHLRPPAPVQNADAAPITLKPPSGFMPAPPKDDGGPVRLRPPPGRFTPAHYDRQDAKADIPGPGLRPALDGLDSAPKGTAPQGPQVQLGAWRSEDEAGAGWNKAVRQAGGLLDGLSPHIVAVDLPGRGRYYRLRAGPVAGALSGLCDALSARGMDCIPARD